jgi:hypothetical protein
MSRYLLVSISLTIHSKQNFREQAPGLINKWYCYILDLYVMRLGLLCGSVIMQVVTIRTGFV